MDRKTLRRWIAELEAYEAKDLVVCGKVLVRARDKSRRRKAWEVRHLLLALAMIRGIPYRRLEPSCREEPSAQLLAFTLDCEVATARAWLDAPATAGEEDRRRAVLGRQLAAKAERTRARKAVRRGERIEFIIEAGGS